MLTTKLPLEIWRWMSFSFSIFLTALMRSSASSSFSTFHILLEMRMWSSFTPSFEAITARIGPMCAMSCRLAVVPPLSDSGRTPRASVLIFASVLFMLFMSVFSISLLPDIGWLGGVLAVSTVLVACAWSRSDKDVRGWARHPARHCPRVQHCGIGGVFCLLEVGQNTGEKTKAMTRLSCELGSRFAEMGAPVEMRATIHHVFLAHKWGRNVIGQMHERAAREETTVKMIPIRFSYIRRSCTRFSIRQLDSSSLYHSRRSDPPRID